MSRALTAALAPLTIVSIANAQEAVSILPDLKKTPGKADAAITVEALRAGKHYVSRATMACAWGRYEIAKTDHKRYRLDHAISLDSNDCDNIWPQPVAESYCKDCLEDVMADLVRRERLPLLQAQHEIATSWIAAFAKYGQTLCSRARRKGSTRS